MQNRARLVEITEPAMIIKFPRLYKPGMSNRALYDATRAARKVGPRRDTAEIALSVADGIVREVYEIDQWQPPGTSQYLSRQIDLGWQGRWEFVGCVAPEPIRSKYIGQSVAHYFRRGNQTPIRYINC